MGTPMPKLETIARGSYAGYDTHYTSDPDEELTRIGPHTPAGEYLRRYWHPVALSRELGERPVLTRVLGEELVLFRDRRDRV